MPKYRHLILATAGVMMLALPASAAYAATAHPASSKPVLTVGKKGGPAVKKHAVLKASLASKTKVSFALGAFNATCKSSRLKAKVTANPSKSGKATLSVTGQTLTKCALSTTLATLKSLKPLNLPYAATISSKGLVIVTGSKSSEPLGFKASITVGTTSATCVYNASKVSGSASNKGNKVSFKSQKFTLNTAASSALCTEAAATATFSATYGPVVDSSVKHSPKVFVS
jgi:predicted RecA/RadA family phage recombinase